LQIIGIVPQAAASIIGRQIPSLREVQTTKDKDFKGLDIFAVGAQVDEVKKIMDSRPIAPRGISRSH
jgi:hypothetical protein